MHLRALHPADAPTLGLVEAAAWRQAYADLLPPRALQGLEPQRLARRWTQRLRGSPAGAYGIEEDGLVVAYALAGLARDPDLDPAFAGELAELYVHPGWQGRGLGALLLAHAWARLADRGLRWGVLWVLRDNSPARAFYRHQGLAEDGRQRLQPVPGGRVPVLRYARPLQALDLGAVLSADGPA